MLFVEDFICLGVFSDEKLLGYEVFESTSGDVTQMDVDKEYCRRGIGSLLSQKMIESNEYDFVKIIDADVGAARWLLFSGRKTSGRRASSLG